MKKVLLAKLGFERDSSQDFEDDGNKFQAYVHPQAPRIRVSKLIADGDVYLSSRIYGDLTYEEYKQLPHYNQAEWMYNGVSISSLTEQDLIDFRDSVIAYQKEYEEMENSVSRPSDEELENKFNQIQEEAIKCYTEAKKLISDNSIAIFFKSSEYELNKLKRYLTNLKNEADKKFIKENYKSRNLALYLINSTIKNYQENYYFKSIKEIVEKATKGE